MGLCYCKLWCKSLQGSLPWKYEYKISGRNTISTCNAENINDVSVKSKRLAFWTEQPISQPNVMVSKECPPV